MPSRRSFGSVYRRRLPGAGPGGKPAYRAGWYVRTRRLGKDERRYAGPDRATAVEYLERLKREQDRERLLGESPQADTTFAEFAPEFLVYAEREWTATSFATLRTLLPNRLVPHFGGLRLRDIRRVHVEKFLATQGHISGASRNRLRSNLSCLFRRAVDLRIMAHNPALEVRRSPEPQFALPLVSVEEQNRLVSLLSGGRRLLVRLALDTGMRLGEMLRLEWRDIDFASGTLMVRLSKAKRPRALVLTALLRQELLAASAARVRSLRGPDPVLRGARAPRGDLNKHWRAAIKAAASAIGHPHLRVHDFRHLAAINLVRAGLDLPTVQRYLGHASLLSTLRYADFSDESAASRAARTLDRVRAAAGAPAGGRD